MVLRNGEGSIKTTYNDFSNSGGWKKPCDDFVQCVAVSTVRELHKAISIRTIKTTDDYENSDSFKDFNCKLLKSCKKGGDSYNRFKQLWEKRCSKQFESKLCGAICWLLTSKICHARMGEWVKSRNDSKQEQMSLRSNNGVETREVTKAFTSHCEILLF